MSSTSVSIDPASVAPAPHETGTGDAESVKANLFLILSRAFADPSAQDAQDPGRLQQLIPDLPAALQSSAAALSNAWVAARQQPQDYSLAYARLFLGPFEILASPYASFYLEHDQQLMGPVSQAVAECYARAGLEPGPGPREAPDHVALQWEFMYFLTLQYVQTGDDDWRMKRSEFVKLHLLTWMPTFAAAIIQAEVSPRFYHELAEFLSRLLGDSDFLLESA